MMNLFLTNRQLFTSQDVNWWTGVVWITCGLLWCFFSAVWTLILTAPIHCRGSIVEQVMQCYFSLDEICHSTVRSHRAHTLFPRNKNIFHYFIMILCYNFANIMSCIALCIAASNSTLSEQKCAKIVPLEGTEAWECCPSDKLLYP